VSQHWNHKWPNKRNKRKKTYQQVHRRKPSEESVRAVIYSRVSTKDKGQDTANQLNQLRELCQARSWQIVAEYEDHDTGSKPDRTQFQALMKDAMRRKFDVILFWALDRFTREGALESLQYLNTLSIHGVGFLSLTEPYLDSCGIFKDAVIAILGTIAKQERLRISERVRAGLQRVRAQGTKTGNPIGRPRVVFRRDLVATLRKEGHSWAEIARTTGASTGTIRRAYRALPDASTPCQNPMEQNP
jgi:DNA invertase Pin-like site-specific DNA recombinase